MSTSNQDLQATHKILQFIEASKQQGELILDQIPGLFAVINSQGEILKGNSLLSEYLDIDAEDMLYMSLATVFRREEWDIFKSHLQHLREGDLDSLDFELNITGANKESKSHLWYLSRFKNAKDELFTVVGKDISELKAAQQNLIEIFSSVPLGILTINEKGDVVGQVSAYTEILLDIRGMTGLNIKDFLIAKAVSLTQVEKDALSSLLASIGNRELIYSVIKDELPARVECKIGEKANTWFSLTYQPIVYEGVVHKVMIILQDVSALVRAEQLQKSKELLEEAHVSRILQLKKMDPETQPIIMDELFDLFGKIKTAIQGADARSICRYLHGIKGCARVSGMRALTEMSHEAETMLLALLDDGAEISLAEFGEILNPSLTEWNELYRLYKALQGDEVKSAPTSSGDGSAAFSKEIKNLFMEYNGLISGVSAGSLKSRYLAREILLSLESYNMHPLTGLESVLLNNVNQTAGTLSKQVKLAFDWDNCYLDKNSLSVLRESLTHLLNNSVDHGIEDSQKRLDSGKDAEGQILISGQDVDGWLRIQCLDDGAGFNIAKIRDIAIRRGICTVGEAMELTDEQVVDFLFHENFSSAETVTEISGRGIGLSAVRKAMIELGGSAAAVMRGGGAVFEIRLPSDRSRPSRKREVPLVEVLGILEQEIEKLRQQGFDLAYELDSDLSDEVSDFMIYSESDAVIFAVIQLIHILSKEKQNKLLISKKTNGMLEVKMEGTLPQLTPSQKYILDSCVLYLQQHKGGIRLGEGVVVAKFGYLKQ